MSKRTNDVLKKKPECPKVLKGLAAEHWNDLVGFLIADHVVCSSDIPVLVMACQCWEKSQLADSDAAMFKAQNQYISIVSKFGVTYQARVKLEMDAKSKPAVKNVEDDNRYLEFK